MSFEESVVTKDIIFSRLEVLPAVIYPDIRSLYAFKGEAREYASHYLKKCTGAQHEHS